MQIFKPMLNTKGKSNPAIGHASNIVLDYVPSVRKEKRDFMQKKINESYSEFPIIIDGSPVGNDAEAILLRSMKKKTKIVSDNLILLKIYSKKLNT